jgi:hypothetical protein
VENIIGKCDVSCSASTPICRRCEKRPQLNGASKFYDLHAGRRIARSTTQVSNTTADKWVRIQGDENEQPEIERALEVAAEISSNSGQIPQTSSCILFEPLEILEIFEIFRHFQVISTTFSVCKCF